MAAIDSKVAEPCPSEYDDDDVPPQYEEFETAISEAGTWRYSRVSNSETLCDTSSSLVRYSRISMADSLHDPSRAQGRYSRMSVADSLNDPSGSHGRYDRRPTSDSLHDPSGSHGRGSLPKFDEASGPPAPYFAHIGTSYDTSSTKVQHSLPGFDKASHDLIPYYDHIEPDGAVLDYLGPRVERSVSAPSDSGDSNREQMYKEFLGRVPAPINNTSSAFKEAAKSLAFGFGEGFSGIVTAPIKGAAREGVVGFGKGVVRGSLGVVVKPTTGALVFAHCSIKGICSAVAKKPSPTLTLTPPEHAQPVIDGHPMSRPVSRESDRSTITAREHPISRSKSQEFDRKHIYAKEYQMSRPTSRDSDRNTFTAKDYSKSSTLR